MRYVRSVSAVVTLIGINAYPIWGVFWGGWDLYSLFMVYWVEVLVNTVAVIPRLYRSETKLRSRVATAAPSGNVAQQPIDVQPPQLAKTMMYGAAIMTCYGLGVLSSTDFAAQRPAGFVFPWGAIGLIVIGYTLSELLHLVGWKQNPMIITTSSPELVTLLGKFITINVILSILAFTAGADTAIPHVALVAMVTIKLVLDIVQHSERFKQRGGDMVI